MKRIRIEKSKGRREPHWLEVLPLDPRDADVLRAKALEQDDAPNATPRHE